MKWLNPRIWVGLLISAWCIFVLARDVRFDEVGPTLLKTNLLFVALAIGTIPFFMWLKALRWRLFFPDPESARNAGLVPALYIGYMVNTIAPLRMGELVRAYLVGHHDRLGVSTVLATIVLEKLFDVGSLAVMLLVLVLTTPLPDWAMAGGVASAVFLAAGVVGTVLAIAAERPMLALTAAVEKRVPLLERLQPTALLSSFIGGLRSVKQPVTLMWVIVWSAVLWVGGALTLYLGMASIGLSGSWPLFFFVIVVTNLGMSVPSAPGYVGVYHYLVVLSMGVFGVDSASATSLAIVLHTGVFGTFLVGGLLYLWRGHFALSQIMAGAQRSAEEAHAH